MAYNYNNYNSGYSTNQNPYQPQQQPQPYREPKDRDAARKIREGQQHQVLPQFASQQQLQPQYAPQQQPQQVSVNRTFQPGAGRGAPVDARVNAAGMRAMPQHPQSFHPAQFQPQHQYPQPAPQPSMPPVYPKPFSGQPPVNY